jgi:hypothetical protein
VVIQEQRDLDHLINFAKRTPDKLKLLWQKNYQIAEDQITSIIPKYKKNREIKSDEHA